MTFIKTLRLKFLIYSHVYFLEFRNYEATCFPPVIKTSGVPRKIKCHGLIRQMLSNFQMLLIKLNDFMNMNGNLKSRI